MGSVGFVVFMFDLPNILELENHYVEWKRTRKTMYVYTQNLHLWDSILFSEVCMSKPMEGTKKLKNNYLKKKKT